MDGRVQRRGWRLPGFLLGLLVTALSAGQATPPSPPADVLVTHLADMFVAEFERRFPFAVLEAGLPLASQSGISINAPQDLVRWRRFVHALEKRLARIPEADVAGRPAWVTRAYLQQAIAQQGSDEACRSELWQVSPYEWAFRLPLIAEAQPVATAKERRETLQRWEGLAAWIDRDAANLAEGLRLGYGGLRGGVEAEIRQIDTLISAPKEQWPTTLLANRAADPVFARHLDVIRTEQLLPAAKRFRAFLQDTYLPRARLSPSITSEPLGLECLRSRLLVATSVDMEPSAMFALVLARRNAEHARLVVLGREVYGVSTLDWAGLVEHVRQDPQYHFHDADDLRTTLAAVIARARAALPRMVTNPPSGQINVEAVPKYAEASAPIGRFLPGSDDGTRQPAFLYRADLSRFPRASAESVALHETIPGHYLQTAMLTERRGTKLHDVARLVYVVGPSEGWATYAESWAEELGLYSSAFEEMGGFLNSVTPAAVADLGMQVMGWDVDKAAEYLQAEMPFWTPTRAREVASSLSPGEVESYPVGVLQYEAARQRAQEALGSRFDSRQFHQMLLSDGALPFAALNFKIDRWIAASR